MPLKSVDNMPNPAEQAQLKLKLKCYLRFGGEWRVEVNCGYIGHCIHTVMRPVLSGLLRQLAIHFAVTLHHHKIIASPALDNMRLKY